MNDFKSKLPDLKELSSMAGKLFKDVKTSVSEIIDEYKKKREQVASNEEKEEVVTKAKAPKRKTTKPKDTDKSKSE